MTNPQTTPQQKQLDLLSEVVNGILSEECDESTRRVFFYIKRTLRQFRLNSQLQESDILMEAYLRIRKKIESGESIKNIPAFLNRVCFNIIREHSKKRKKSEELHTRLIDNNYRNLKVALRGDSSDTYKITILLESLQKLKNEDLEILQLRIVQGFSWKEINEYFSSHEGNTPSISALRKRGERALKRLREAYTSVEKVHSL